jgi:hypothetical protein
MPQDIGGWVGVCLEVFPHASAEDWYRAALAHMADPKRGGFWPAPADLGRHLPQKQQDMTPEAAFEHCCAIVSRFPHNLSEAQKAPFHAEVAKLNAAQRQALSTIGGLFKIRTSDINAWAGMRVQFITACQLPVTEEQERVHAQRQVTAQQRPAIAAPVDVPEEDRVSAAEIGALLRRHNAAPRRPDRAASSPLAW